MVNRHWDGVTSIWTLVAWKTKLPNSLAVRRLVSRSGGGFITLGSGCLFFQNDMHSGACSSAFIGFSFTFSQSQLKALSMTHKLIEIERWNRPKSVGRHMMNGSSINLTKEPYISKAAISCWINVYKRLKRVVEGPFCWLVNDFHITTKKKLQI